MKNRIRTLFSSLGIEYYAPLSISDTRITKERLIRECGFEARSVIVFLVPYFVSYPENISAYAASYDYHAVISKLTDRLAEGIKEIDPTLNAKGFGDHSPIDERHAALIGGLGIAGDNGLIINEKYGSYIFIGELITDIDPILLDARICEIDTCEHCGACRAACPTGILAGSGTDCLSAITQRKGSLSESEIALMRENRTAWGCDVCQRVCPHNRNVSKTPLLFFYENRVEKLTGELLSSMDDGELKRRAFGWRGRAVLMRNIEIFESEEKKNEN